MSPGERRLLYLTWLVILIFMGLFVLVALGFVKGEA